ncbi:MAG TPA: hypothetical protein VMN36_00640 [Verrucomicrobiales bacterium]|nr:hypothetical protein [Verrucomicrobiales bacterium]
MPASVRDPNAVFLNVPFDNQYEKQFIELIAATIAVGRTPRCVLEIAETGIGRLTRLLEIISASQVSVHDLSRVGVPARFNMPFELGLACAVGHFEPPHAFILIERVQYRVQRTLSDLNGRDPYIHGGSIRGSINCIVDALRPSGGRVRVEDVVPLYRTLAEVGKYLKRQSHPRTLFSRANFIDLVAAGVERAQDLKLIKP